MTKQHQSRKQRADVRTQERATLTAREQITRLDTRLGVGVGATKERTRLNKQV